MRCLDFAYYPHIANFRVPFAEIGAISKLKFPLSLACFFSCCLGWDLPKNMIIANHPRRRNET
ncbi:hypothetical protein T08_12704 [Trichinella sp. T8]|nr:hypothetical protein T08_12704 [Trichinella sp. T8]